MKNTNAANSSPRIRAVEVAQILGLGVRCVQKMAARGELPSAAQIGKLWTFDKARIEQFLADAETDVESRKETIPSVLSGSRYTPSIRMDAEVHRAYEQAMAKLHGGYATKRSRGSRAKGTASNDGRKS
ncbi:helix-turn-helix domain-containing protein [Methylosinus sporium]|uniref:helix-turn-helix domain-containing protein n=1 Tax=Methylosinus sporium TaxID=428 RepID=UPI00383B39B6